MRVQFVKRDGGIERLVTEAEIVFEETGLEGMKLVGFSLWKAADDELYVTFPSRAFGAGSDRRFFDYLRTTGETADAARRLKTWIIEEYRRACAVPVVGSVAEMLGRPARVSDGVTAPGHEE